MGEVELGLKQSFQEEKETSRAGNGRNGAVFAAEDSFVDQFLNLQNADDNTQEVAFPENLQISTKASAFVPPPLPITSAGEDWCSILALPEEEPELEWLSQFMEDSFSPPYAAGGGIPPRPEHKTLPARSKCHLSGRGPVWPISSSSATESTTRSSSSSSATSSPCPPTSPSTPFETQTRRPRHRPATLARMCSHCGSQKTPQWRAGPTGKTLCNACGVRFKSGRLFPEYRPVSSPTFSNEAHSNSHKKVLEMRKKQQKMSQAEPGFKPGLTSFG